MAALLEVQGLRKRYGGITALDGVHLSITRGETVGLVGKNGAGKTTLLSLIAGLLRADAGTITLAGFGIEHPALMGKLTFQPQETCLKRGIPVIRQLVHFCRLLGMPATDANAAIDRLSRELGTQDYITRPVETLSYGQGKRLNLLQAFLGVPELILLDEPTAGLDPLAAADVRHLIQGRAGHIALLISSHNLYELQDLCSRVLVLDQGRLLSNIDIRGQARRSDVLRIKLNQAADEPLILALSHLPETTQLTIDQHDKTRLTLHFAGSNPDQLQLRIQGIILEHGRSVIQLNRGNSLNDDMRDLLSQDSLP